MAQLIGKTAGKRAERIMTQSQAMRLLLDACTGDFDMDYDEFFTCMKTFGFTSEDLDALLS